MRSNRLSAGMKLLTVYLAWAFLLAPMMGYADEVAAALDRDALPQGSLTVGALYTEDYWEGIGDVIAPLYFNGEGLLFINPRTSRTDNSASEVNIGIGYRQLLRERTGILGANLYYDYRDTTAGSRFHQFGAGVEYLSRYLDFRANVYIPTDTREKVNEFSATETSASRSSSSRISTDFDDPYAQGNAVLQDYSQTRTTRISTTTTSTTRYYEQYEIAYRGFDVEIGTELPLPVLEDYVRIKPYVGMVNYYGRSGLPDIESFRGRLEMHFRPSFYIDAVYLSDDKLTGGNFTIGAYMVLPFDIASIAQGRNPFAGASDRWTAGTQADVTWRLGEMVKRDPQIRATVAEPEEIVEAAVSSSSTSTSTSRKDLGDGTATILADVTFVNNENAGTPGQDGTYENPYDSVQEGVDNANSPVWVFTGNAPYEETVEVKAGVQLYGQGTVIQALGGKTWGGGEHPVLIGQEAAPVVTILGDNTAVSGFDIRHGGVGNVPLGDLQQKGSLGASVIDPVTSLDVTYAGIYGSQVSGFNIDDNIMTDGSLSYGILIANNGSMKGGNIDMVGTFLRNDIQNTSESALHVEAYEAYGGSGIFNTQISGNYSDSGTHGIYVRTYGHDEAYTRLYDVTANDNNSYGVHVRLEASDMSSVRMDRIEADRNVQGVSGRAFAYGDGGEAWVIMNDVQANDNVDWGLYYAYAQTYDSDRGNAYVYLDNITANGNNYGMDIFANAHGTGADAIIYARNLEANFNTFDGIYYISAYAFDGGAYIDVANVTANSNAGDGISYLEADASGDGSVASVVMNDVTANDNGQSGIDYIHADSNNGDAFIVLSNVTANGNMDHGIRGISAFSVAHDARVVLTGVETSGNGFSGIDCVWADTWGADQDAVILIDGLTANNNGNAGIRFIYSYALGNAMIDLKNAEALSNEGHGAMIVTDSVGGDASVTVANSTFSENLGSGLLAAATGGAGAATIEVTGVNANGNTSYGVELMAVAKGADADATNILRDSDVSGNTVDAHNIIATATGGGNATNIIDNVIE